MQLNNWFILSPPPCPFSILSFSGRKETIPLSLSLSLSLARSHAHSLQAHTSRSWVIPRGHHCLVFGTKGAHVGPPCTAQVQLRAHGSMLVHRGGNTGHFLWMVISLVRDVTQLSHTHTHTDTHPSQPIYSYHHHRLLLTPLPLSAPKE